MQKTVGAEVIIVGMQADYLNKSLCEYPKDVVEQVSCNAFYNQTLMYLDCRKPSPIKHIRRCGAEYNAS